LFVSSGAGAEPIIIQIINGKTNKPISKAKLYVSFVPSSGHQSLQLVTNENGEASFDSEGLQLFQVHPIALVSCGEQPIGAQQRNYSVEDVLKTGIRAENNCGHSDREPLRGRLLYFVRPASWWELFKN
jgi:hypothetical protein